LKIQKLPEEVINKIAAGEIVERPASVLKELIENSIDAGATSIEISIEKGGKSLISVKDNGEGIPQNDLTLAVQRFCTSKIKSEEDLYMINSYGFRGEALSSISSVSKFKLTSRVLGELTGHQIYIEGGKFKHLMEVGSQLGTTVEVRDLFFNVPARQKFLKTERTELIHVLDVFTKYVLNHTDKHFKLFIDKKEYYNVYPSTLTERLSQIISKDFIRNLVEINYENQLGKIYGLVSIGDSPNKKGYIFVNGRPVRNYLISSTVKSLIGDNFYILFLELPPYFVDTNVHPAKIEVKFRKESSVVNLIKGGISEKINPFKTNSYIDNELKQEVSTYGKESPKFEIVGQIENTFLVAYYNGEIYIIDQHVAHERVQYEILMNEYLEKGKIPSQKLISPIPLKLTPDETAKLMNLKEKLNNIGYEFKIQEPNVFITGIPASTSIEAAEEALNDILYSNDIFVPVEEMFSRISCRQSVMAGDKLNYEKAKSILEMWIKTENPNLCPHGRPIYYKISLDEVKKVVGRK
jgi:DNA mismatch repair protein MutL